MLTCQNELYNFILLHNFENIEVSLGNCVLFQIFVLIYVLNANLSPQISQIDDFRGACAVKGNGAVAGHVKRVDYDDVFDALLFREETLTHHYFILKFDFSWGIRTNMGKTEGIFLNLQCNCHIVGSIIIN